MVAWGRAMGSLFARVFGLVAVLFLISGCSSMISTHRFAGEDAKGPESQHAGSYFLPKHLLRVTVQGTKDSFSITTASVAVSDPRTLSEVGYELSGFSNDDIKVDFEDNGLLKAVASTSTDKTGEIIIQIAKQIGGFREGEQEKPLLASYDFDPFDLRAASEVNAKLSRRFKKSCVEIELVPNIWSGGCRAGSKSIGTAAAAVTASELQTLPPKAPGIYYRRPINHRVHIIEAGESKEMKTLQFANAAPIFRIDIDRTAFVARSTTLAFKDGVPTSVQVVKPSEVLEVAGLPLKVVNAVISAPVDAITERQKLATAQAALYQEQAKLLAAERELKVAIANSSTASDLRQATLPAISTNRSAVLSPSAISLCQNIGIDPQNCSSALLQ